MVDSDAGVLLFTGYVVCEPTLKWVGAGVQGPEHLLEMAALSDEVALDRQGVPSTPRTAPQTVGNALSVLTNRVAGRGTQTIAGDTAAVVGSFLPDAAAAWSKNAAELASMTRSAYRVVDGAVRLSPVGANVHVLNETDGSFHPQGLTATRAKMLTERIRVSQRKRRRSAHFVALHHRRYYGRAGAISSGCSAASIAWRMARWRCLAGRC